MGYKASERVLVVQYTYAGAAKPNKRRVRIQLEYVLEYKFQQRPLKGCLKNKNKEK